MNSEISITLYLVQQQNIKPSVRFHFRPKIIIKSNAKKCFHCSPRYCLINILSFPKKVFSEKFSSVLVLIEHYSTLIYFVCLFILFA